VVGEGPAFERIAAELAEKIDRGELRHGDRLPTRPELESKYSVSRFVTANALTLLQQAGYIRSTPGPHGGNFVVRLPRLSLPMYVLEADERALDAFIAAVNDQQHTGRQEIRVETAHPDPQVAAALKLEPEELVTIRRRVRFVDEVPYALADSYFPHSLATGTALADPADIARGGRWVLAELGAAMNHHQDSIEARRPHVHERSTLDIAPGLAVITHQRLSATAEGRPVRLMRSVFPSDRWTLTYEVTS
jgi:GntR family transcriptional regulator